MTGRGPLTWGGAEGTRTPDPLHAMEVRYQLRHSPFSNSPASLTDTCPKLIIGHRHHRAGGLDDESAELAPL
jgi:hypothetical protein